MGNKVRRKTERINSRQKGAAAERELATLLVERGYVRARRGQQFKGGAESPDVVGLDGFHVECKRVEQGNLYKWLDQAIKDAGDKSTPLVVHRKNKREWVAILRFDDFLNLLVTIGM